LDAAVRDRNVERVLRLRAAGPHRSKLVFALQNFGLSVISGCLAVWTTSRCHRSWPVHARPPPLCKVGRSRWTSGWATGSPRSAALGPQRPRACECDLAPAAQGPRPPAAVSQYPYLFQPRAAQMSRWGPAWRNVASAQQTGGRPCSRFGTPDWSASWRPPWPRY